MLQILRVPMELPNETESEYVSRVVVPYPIVAPDILLFRRSLGLLGLAQSEIRIKIIDGEAESITLLFQDGTVLSTPEEVENHRSGALLAVRSVMERYVKEKGFSFENNVDKIDNIDNERLYEEMNELNISYIR